MIVSLCSVLCLLFCLFALFDHSFLPPSICLSVYKFILYIGGRTSPHTQHTAAAAAGQGGGSITAWEGNIHTIHMHEFVSLSLFH